MNALLFYSALCIYFIATVTYMVYLVKPREILGRAAHWLIAGGFLVHCAFTVARYFEAGHTPITNLHESLSFFSLTVIGVFIAFERKYHVFILGSFVTPLAFILMLASSLYPSAIPELPPALKSKWLFVHSTLAFISYATFTVAFGAAIMYLIQEHFLKKKRLGPLLPEASLPRYPGRDQLSLPDHRLPPADGRHHHRRHLGRNGLGDLLELGPQGDLVADHLVHLCRPAPRQTDHRLARQEGGLALHRRLSYHAFHLSRG